MSQSFESSRAPEPVGAFPHAKRVGDLLFLSGIGPRVRGTKEIPGVTLDSAGDIVSYDIETQCRAVFENVRLVLEDAGATWQDIIDVTVFLTNMKEDFPIYNRLYAEYFAGPGKPNPTRTTSEVTAVPGAEISLAVLKGYGHKIELLEYLAPANRKRIALRPCDVGSVHVALLVDSLDAVLERIAASGWQAAGKPQTLKTGPNAGKRVVYVRDPDGTTIELMQPAVAKGEGRIKK